MVVVVSVTILAFQGSSRPWLVLALSSVGAVGALIAVVAGVVAGYNGIRFQRLTTANLQRASSAADETLPEKDRDRIAELLASAADEVAAEQEISPEKIRAALFGWDGKVLRIRPGLAWHIEDPDELNIQIRPGEGSAGRAYRTREQNIALYHDPRSDSSIRDEGQRSRVDPELKWIISTPIFGMEHRMLGVLNVDGLTEVRTFDQLRRSLDGQLYWAHLAGILLGAVTGGRK